jgi:hypothetical protein
VAKLRAGEHNEQQFAVKGGRVLWRALMPKTPNHIYDRVDVHGTITSDELPVTQVTRWIGSPYTLVLTKPRALFTRDATERATWMRDRAWLRENAKMPRRMRAQRK